MEKGRNFTKEHNNFIKALHMWRKGGTLLKNIITSLKRSYVQKGRNFTKEHHNFISFTYVEKERNFTEEHNNFIKALHMWRKGGTLLKNIITSLKPYICGEREELY